MLGSYTRAQVLILMHGRDLVSVNKVSNALHMKPETKNTHRSFHGSEPGICRTAVLWQDCTGSALKRMKMKPTLARLWWLYRTRNGNDSFFYQKKKLIYTSLILRTEASVWCTIMNTHSALVWRFVAGCFHTHLVITIHSRPLVLHMTA